MIMFVTKLTDVAVCRISHNVSFDEEYEDCKSRNRNVEPMFLILFCE